MRNLASLGLCAGLFALSLPAVASDYRMTDGLQPVAIEHVDHAWIRAGAELGQYHKILIDPATLSFRKNWARDRNRRADGATQRIRAQDLERISADMRKQFDEVYAAAFTKAGYQVVNEPGPGVLRLSPQLTQFELNNPALRTAGRTEVFVMHAGEATLALEMRDAQSNQLLVYTEDRRETRDLNILRRSSEVFNRADFRDLFRTWARISANDLDQINLQPTLAGN